MNFNKAFFILIACSSSLCFSDLDQYLKSNFGTAAKNESIPNIDAIYLINLDQRPEKLKESYDQFDPYNIKPYRFSAINGWGLEIDTLIGIGMLYEPGMHIGKYADFFSREKGVQAELELLTEKLYGKRCVVWNMRPGAIGCALSHLSILQNAYDNNYDTIWVLEDDISVQENPHLLSRYIKKLDEDVGQDGWDILYTDMDTMDHQLYNGENDFLSDLQGDTFLWRPDIELDTENRYAKRKIINDDFVQINCRNRAHSLIIRRSGIKKILEFEKTHHLFLPYDIEIFVIPGIRAFNLRHNIVTVNAKTSDTKFNYFKNTQKWESFKTELFAKTAKKLTRDEQEIADKILDFIHVHHPKLCVGIDALDEGISFPIAEALQYENCGTLCAINACDKAEDFASEQNLNKFSKNDTRDAYESFHTLIQKTKLDKVCHPVRTFSQDYASSFSDNSIELLYFNAQVLATRALDELFPYFQKVKEGGYIWIDKADLPSSSNTVAYLMSHFTWLRNSSIGNQCLVFRKETRASGNLYHSQVSKKTNWLLERIKKIFY